MPLPPAIDKRGRPARCGGGGPRKEIEGRRARARARGGWRRGGGACAGGPARPGRAPRRGSRRGQAGRTMCGRCSSAGPRAACAAGRPRSGRAVAACARRRGSGRRPRRGRRARGRRSPWRCGAGCQGSADDDGDRQKHGDSIHDSSQNQTCADLFAGSEYVLVMPLFHKSMWSPVLVVSPERVKQSLKKMIPVLSLIAILAFAPSV